MTYDSSCNANGIGFLSTKGLSFNLKHQTDINATMDLFDIPLMEIGKDNRKAVELETPKIWPV